MERSRPVTIVTGGSRGIGAAAALHLAEAGHAVAISYRRDREAADRIVEQVTSGGGLAVAVVADVVDADDIDRLFATAEEALGPVTGLVNNAGLTAHIGDLADTPVETIRLVLDVNLLGVILCARRAAAVMSTRRGGSGGAIVNISSAAATLGSPHEYVHYAAAKAGVDALTLGLSKELAGDGIRVNAVAPGLIRTEIHAAAGDAGRVDRAASRIPMGYAGETGHVVPAIAWLLSDTVSYVTGTVLRVAGGL
jgi:glucose 1-dehydrogenase